MHKITIATIIVISVTCFLALMLFAVYLAEGDAGDYTRVGEEGEISKVDTREQVELGVASILPYSIAA